MENTAKGVVEVIIVEAVLGGGWYVRKMGLVAMMGLKSTCSGRMGVKKSDKERLVA